MTTTHTIPHPATTSPPTPTNLHTLLHTHLQKIWSQPSPHLRRALYPSIYHPDITFFETDGRMIRGYDGMDEIIEGLVGKSGSGKGGGRFEGWEFRVDLEGEGEGEGKGRKGAAKGVKRNGGFVWVGWRFGPKRGGEEVGEGEVDVKSTGADAILLDVNENGEARIKTMWVVIDGQSDVAKA